MALGLRDTSTLVLMTGWDATELKNFELRDGTTYAQIVAQMNAALGGLNAELYNDPLWSSLVSYQNIPEVEYRVGTSNGFSEHTEFGRPDPKRAETEGHMLPFKKYDRFLTWTTDYLEDARLDQIQADIADAIKDARDIWRQKILTRLLKRTDDSGATLGLGTSGYSPGFATAAASTNVDFVPPAYGGTSFDSSHEHYVGITGGAFTAAVFQDAAAELREHGHEPPYEFIIGTSDQTAVEDLPGFVPTARNLVTYGAMQDLANLSNAADMNGGYYIGTIHDFAVKVVRGVPQYYGFGWKSYGANSQRNPVRVRLNKNMTRPMVMAMPDPNAGMGIIPLQNMMLQIGFGVGVSDRTNGTARYTNSATWADGTPT